MFRQVFLVIFASLVLSEIATAGVVRIPDLDVPATGIPVSFVTEHEWLPTDSLVLSAEGITCTLAGCELRLNAAGIVAFNSLRLTRLVIPNRKFMTTKKARTREH